ncbi:MAG: hypothetical protein ABIB71_01435 [Candidatus Woesearchaeota archaeon]
MKHTNLSIMFECFNVAQKPAKLFNARRVVEKCQKEAAGEKKPAAKKKSSKKK